MNKSEFERWWTHYGQLFPETVEWVRRVSDEDRKPMLDAWAKLLEDVELRDVMAATELMFGADDPQYPALGVMFGDRERTPSHVRRLAKQIHYERTAREAERRAARQEREAQHANRADYHGYRYTMGELLRAYIGPLKAGDPDARRKMHAMADERGDKPAVSAAERQGVLGQMFREA